MKNLLIPILLIAITVGFGCKNIQNVVQENSVQEKSIVGKWWGIRKYEPNSSKWDETPTKDFIFEFQSNGDFGSNIFGYTVGATYILDTKSVPKQIVFTGKKDKKQTFCAYKFQGDRLIIKIPTDSKYGVAKDFNPEPNYLIMELERK